MNVTIKIEQEEYTTNLSKGRKLSIPLKSGNSNPKAFYAADPSIDAVQTENFIGDTRLGGLLNFKNVSYNPHGNGTHTECVGHIAKESYTLNKCLTDYHSICQLTSITPDQLGADYVITKAQLEAIDWNNGINSVVIRTLPNSDEKMRKDWSGTNPPYIHHAAIKYLVDLGIEHFLIDVPSVDREEDDGKLLAHKAFWNYPSKEVRLHATISEMVFVSNDIEDGLYLLNIQVSALDLDASSSNIVIYPLLPKK